MHCRDFGDHRTRTHTKAGYDQSWRPQRGYAYASQARSRAACASISRSLDPAYLRHSLHRRKRSQRTHWRFPAQLRAPSTTSLVFCRAKAAPGTISSAPAATCATLTAITTYSTPAVRFLQGAGSRPAPCFDRNPGSPLPPELLIEIEAIAMFRTDKPAGDKA